MSTQQVVILILVVVAVIAAAVLLRKQPSSATASTDVNAEMLFLADDAVKWAAEKNVTLDYTPESVERVEGLLAELHEKRAAGKLPDDQVNKAAARYGAYVGEVIRRMHNGSWAVDHEVAGPGSFPIRWRDHESFPLGWCRKRIINGEEDNVWYKFRVLLLGDAEDAVSPTPDGGDGGPE